MNYKKWILLLIIAALLSTIAVLSNTFSETAVISITAFPYEQIAGILRKLSLSNSIGNLTAILLYIFLCCSPLLLLFHHCRKKMKYKADILLPILCILLFAGIYLYINPGYCRMASGIVNTSASYNIAIGSTLWSVIAGYIVLRILHGMENHESVDLLRSLDILLIIISIIIVYGIFGNGLSTLITTIKNVAANNSSDILFEIDRESSGLLPTYIWLAIQYILDYIPSILLLWIIYLSRRLVATLQENSYSEEAAARSTSLGLFSRNTVIVITLLCILKNIIQLLGHNWLYNSNYHVEFPVTSLLFTFTIMLFSKKLSDSRNLKLDNDRFI